MLNWSINKILAGPDYFTCQRLNARLPKSVCIRRQTKKVIQAPNPTPIYLCQDCAQGGEIARGKGKAVPNKKPPVACAFASCVETAKVRGLCPNHYSKWTAGHLPDMGPFVRVRKWKRTGQRPEV